MITILDKNGNKIKLINASVSQTNNSGGLSFYVKEDDKYPIAQLRNDGTVIIIGNPPHIIEPAIKPTIDSILFDLTQPSNRRQFSEAKLGKLKRILQQFDSKKLQWKKGTENQIF